MKKRALIINAPWYYPQAHKTLLSLLNHNNYHNYFDKVIFMGSAAPLASIKPSSLLSSYLSKAEHNNNWSTELTDKQSCDNFKEKTQINFDLLDSCAQGYRQWAHHNKITLLVCGMAAKRFFQDSKLSSCDGLELTGFMEVLSLLNGKPDEVVIW